MALALTASLEASRMETKLAMTGIPPEAITYSIYRTSHPSGNVAGVRGAISQPTNGLTAIFVRDWEVPFGVAVTYRATIYDADGAQIGVAEVGFQTDWSGCDAWLNDLARPTNSLPVEIVSLRELDFGVPAGVHRVLNRRAPVMTTLPAWTPSAELIVLTETLNERDRVRALLGSGYPFLLRTVRSQGIGNIYFGLTEFVEERILGDGYAPERQFRIACIQVERPDPALVSPAAPMTYEQVNLSWASYAEMLAAVSTYDGLLYAFPDDLLAAQSVVAWLPDDV